MTNKKLLIVEDDDTLRAVLTEKCNAGGFEVFVAADGEEAYALASEHHPQVILLDIVMPKMDGISFMQKIKKEEWGQNTEVVILTNLNESDKIAQAMQSGVYDYFVKANTDLEDVLHLVKTKLALD